MPKTSILFLNIVRDARHFIDESFVCSQKREIGSLCDYSRSLCVQKKMLLLHVHIALFGNSLRWYMKVYVYVCAGGCNLATCTMYMCTTYRCSWSQCVNVGNFSQQSVVREMKRECRCDDR